MSFVTASRKGNVVSVKCPYWTVEHDATRGGSITSITFPHGSGRNLLTAPLSSRVRILDPNPTSDMPSTDFYEQKSCGEGKLDIETTQRGVAIIAEGELQTESGKRIGVRYRTRTEYREWGLVTCELELVCPEGRSDVVEVGAFDLSLRAGMTDAYVRENPVVDPAVGLTGMGRWYALAGGAKYHHRYVPMHVVIFERGGEGIEFSAPTDIHGWNTAFNSDPGMGYFSVGRSGASGETTLHVWPYCVAYRRNPTSLKGSVKLRWHFGLPFIKPRAEVFTSSFHASCGSRWPTDGALERIASAGVKILRFHNDYRRDGPFWHDGSYPPYDEAGMKELRRVIDTAHRLGMRIVPYISVKEFHPESKGHKENQEAWRQQPGPTFPEFHTWAGKGEFGQLMCLESGWFEFLKKYTDNLLRELPFDGFYFDWCTPHACRNPHHHGGRIHSDQDVFFDFLFWVRERIGPEGVIISHISGLPEVVVENLSTMLLIYEDQPYQNGFPEPPDYAPQCEMMPVVPHLLIGAPKGGTPAARTTLMSSLLQGTVVQTGASDDKPREKPGPEGPTWSEDFVAEMRLLAGEGLASMKFARATERAVATGVDKVYGAVWYKEGRALVYLGNFLKKPAKGTFQIDKRIWKAAGLSPKAKLLVEQINGPGRVKATQVPASKAMRGLPYALKGLGSGVFRISPATR